MFLNRRRPTPLSAWQTAAMACTLVLSGVMLGQNFSRPAPAVSASSANLSLGLPSERQVGSGAVYPVEVIRINDGDTFEARVRIWPG